MNIMLIIIGLLSIFGGYNGVKRKKFYGGWEIGAFFGLKAVGLGYIFIAIGILIILFSIFSYPNA